MKKAEQKANKLIERFSPYCYGNDYDNGAETEENAKQCALICVEEVIQSMPLEPHTTKTLDYNIAYSEALKFWQEVKQIIKNK